MNKIFRTASTIAIAADPQRIYNFYTIITGLRQVSKTWNLMIRKPAIIIFEIGKKFE